MGTPPVTQPPAPPPGMTPPAPPAPPPPGMNPPTPPPPGAGAALKVDMVFQIPAGSGGSPHDPAVDSKGVSWWTDQNASRIGFWDPATNATMSFATPTPNCGVHGLTPDDKDNIWYTGQACGRIGRVDAATKQLTDFVVPGGGGPHTPVFLDGIIWFTIQSGGRLGRLDTRTPSEVQTFPIGPGPYGIWIAPNRKLWVALFSTNQIVEVDPANPGEPNRIMLPNAGSRPRRIAVDKNGHVYYTDAARGYLGRYDPSPETAQADRFREWRTPMGAAPYAITVGPEGDNRIFYGFNGRNIIAVFDPANPMQEQAVIQIPVQVTANRHMTTDNVRRRIWLGLSGAARMAYIQLP
jgi:virginiamycin B lyase